MMVNDIFSLADHPERLDWEFFRPGVDIHHLYNNGPSGSSAAFLKYEPGATVPEHDHTGYEHIIVLSGAQRDHQGNHQAGTLVINEPGSHHNIVSEEGCIILIIWEKPVAIRENSTRS
ncbi:MAG: cupin domain-containing protein [Phormidesmis sp.]